jgi:hypothetical protein
MSADELLGEVKKKKNDVYHHLTKTAEAERMKFLKKERG